MFIHVLPKNEIDLHDKDLYCGCSPAVFVENEIIVIHSPFLSDKYTKKELLDWVENVKNNFIKLTINKDIFFNEYKKNFNGILSKSIEGLSKLIELCNDKKPFDNVCQLAYFFATIKHETALTFKPIRELGSVNYFIKNYFINPLQRRWLANESKSDAVKYCGRGYAMITGKGNYKRFANYLNIDILNSPELALMPSVAFEILVYGFKHGAFAQKNNIEYYINENKCNYLDARKIINGTDKKNLVAEYAKRFEVILKKSI
jgi:predicted chitinase